MKILPQNFRQFFVEPPNSDEELIGNILGYMSMLDPKWLQNCKPASPEDIECLEKMLAERFVCNIPSSYKAYLESMGEEDGGLVSGHMESDSEFWECFKGDNMAQGAMYHIEHINEQMAQGRRTSQEPKSIPPFWNFYYSMLAGQGWGFSPKAKYPDQIVQTSGIEQFYFSHDTFSKFLLYCAYDAITDRLWSDATEFCDLSDDTHGVWMTVKCPKAWFIPKANLLVHFLNEIEHCCSIDECWFSSQKEFNLFNTDGTVTEIPYEFARYVGWHSMGDLTVSMYFKGCYADCLEIGILIISQDAGYTKQLVDEISKRTTLIEKSFTIRCID